MDLRDINRNIEAYEEHLLQAANDELDGQLTPEELAAVNQYCLWVQGLPRYDAERLDARLAYWTQQGELPYLPPDLAYVLHNGIDQGIEFARALLGGEK